MTQQTLSQAVVTALTDGPTQLKDLRKRIQSKLKTDTRYSYDDGVRDLYAFVGSNSVIRFESLSQPLPANEFDILTNKVAPLLTVFVSEMEDLWQKVQAVVDAGGDGQTVTDTYNEDDPASGSFKLEMALDKYYDLHPTLGLMVSAEALGYMGF